MYLYSGEPLCVHCGSKWLLLLVKTTCALYEYKSTDIEIFTD